MRSEQMLEAQVQERTQELQRALEAAKLADLAKDQFLANVSHELRTPLNAVIGMSGLARDISADPKAVEYLDKVISAGRMLSSTIDDLLDISKIVAGRMELDILSFRVRQIVASSVAVLGYQAEAKGLKLSSHVAVDVPEVVIGAPLRIKQVLVNLIGNAIKFTERGKVEVNVTAAGIRNDGYAGIQFEISDTGIGLSEQDVARLFQPFQQADATISRKYGGTGLGLALCKRLVELHGGTISVRSVLGRGTTFEVRLWLRPDRFSPAPEYSEEPVVASAPSRYADARVLVVDDHVFNCEVAESLLSAAGISVDVAYNGSEALRRIRGEDGYPSVVYDMVLMDVQMPVMDGLSATRALRGSEEYALLPVIAMTAHTMVHEKETTRAAGMNDHLGKPFALEDFYRLLERWIPAHKRVGAANEGRRDRVAGAPVTALKTLTDVDGLDATAGVARIGGNAERYHHWLKEFLASGPQFVELLRTTQRKDTLESMIDPIHAFKGRVGLLGMTRLHAQLAQLENALEQSANPDASRDSSARESAIDEIGQTVTALCASINTCLLDNISAGEVA